MIHLTIDGIPVEVEKGTTILQAAKQIGVKIPTLCYLENVLPDGSCRLCVVEVTNNGRTKFDTACTLRCSEGDEVQTMSEKVVRDPGSLTVRSSGTLLFLRSQRRLQAAGLLLRVRRREDQLPGRDEQRTH